MVFDKSTDSTEMMPKIVSLIVAVVVFACVLVPVCSSLANGGQNDSDSGSDGDGTALSNEQYVLSKMAYGEHPTFDITMEYSLKTLDEIEYGGEVIQLNAVEMAIIYADAQTVIYMPYSVMTSGSYQLPVILHIDNTTFDEPYLEEISIRDHQLRIVSDGTQVNVYESETITYTFDIVSPCYYSDPNGEYGCYVNPEVFALVAQAVEQEGMDYTPTYPSSLYISDGYTPYFVYPIDIGGNLRLAYGDCGQSNITESYVKSCTPYYTVADGQISDVGWDYEIDVPHGGESNITTGTAVGHYMILPNTISGESGGSGGSSDTGITGTLISIIPVFVVLALILYIVGMFYTNKVE